MTIPRNRLNVALLAVAQALFMSSAIIGFLFGGLVGKELADNDTLATLPIALMIVGTACTTLPASFYMRRFGRRAGFLTGALMGAASASLGVFAIYQESFVLFCLSGVVLGVYQAFSLYYRFAAAESVGPEYRSRAISYVFWGGIVAAVIGPQTGAWAKDLLDPIEFAGSYGASAVLCLIALVPLAFFRNPPREEIRKGGDARPITAIMGQPVFITAALNACAAYGLMSLVMTAAPVAMVGCGFQVSHAANAIQWHALSMFVPSLFTGVLIARLGVSAILFAGMALFAGGMVAATSGIAEINFIATLMLVGVGWNFMFIGGTTLLTESYTADEMAKTQGANELLVSSFSAAASFSSGALLALIGWDAVNYAVVPALMIVAAVTVWYGLSRRRAVAAAE